MKNSLVIFTAAVIGGITGSLATGSLGTSTQPRSATLKARELVIVDENGRPAARLTSSGGETVLRFYTDGVTPAMEIGATRNPPSRFVRMMSRDGNIVAGLNSQPPDGHTTLALGDQRRPTRIVLGALGTADIPRDGTVDEWGLLFRTPGIPEPRLSVLIKSKDAARPSAAIRLIRPDGTEWTVY